jgi:chitodextrinase
VVTISNCIIVGNTGTGITSQSNAQSTVDVINCLIIGNNGGGIYNYHGRLTTINCTIVGNKTSGSGGGILSGNTSVNGQSTITAIYNTIVVENTANGTGQDIYNFGTFAGYNNLIGNMARYALANPVLQDGVNGNIVGQGTTGLVVSFLADAAWSTWDLCLASGSPAIDKGNNEWIPLAIMTDLDDEARIANGIVDIGAYEYQPPPAPTNFRSTGMTAISVTLAWDTVADATGYQIRYRPTGTPGDGGWTTVTVTGQSTATKEITSLSANSPYDFQIRAILPGTNAYTRWSETVPERTLLATPANFRSTAQTTSSLILAWNAVSGANSYEIQYRQSGLSWSSPITDITGPTREFPDLLPNTMYEFQIRAVNTSGNNSLWTPTPPLSVATLPTAPTNLRSTNQTQESISLAWDAPTNGATSYKLEYSLTGVGTTGWTQIGGTITTPSYTHNLLNPDTDYYYRVSAVNSSGVSAPSTPVCPAKTLPLIKLDTPTNVTATTDNARTITVNWDEVSHASGYTIEYAIDENLDGGDVLVYKHEVEGSAVTADIRGLEPETTYYVRVKAIGTGAYSDSDPFSPPVSVETPPAPPLIDLLSPTDVTAIAKGSDTITVNWNVVDNATGYAIECAADPAFEHGIVFDHYVDGGGTITADIHEPDPVWGLEPNTIYYVRIKAIGDEEVWDDSDWFYLLESVKTFPAAPTNLQSTVTTTDSIELIWLAPPNGADSYTLEFSLDGIDWTLIDNTITDAFYTHESLTSGTYHYRVFAVNSSGISDSSNETSEMIESVQPDMPTITAHPQSATYTQGDTADPLTITASGNGDLSYQWYKDDEAITSETSNLYEPSTDTVGIFAYYCIVTNTLNGISEMAMSDTVIIEVTAPVEQPDVPVITAHPQSATYMQGQTTTSLSVSVASVNGELTYQWHENGAEITGATSATFTPPTNTVGEAGYYCIVRNTLNGTWESATSNTAIIEVTALVEQPDVPVITAHPQSATYTQEQTATTLLVTASGNGTLGYQWYKDGAIITDATSDSYEPSTDTVGIFAYYCIVTNTLNGI